MEHLEQIAYVSSKPGGNKIALRPDTKIAAYAGWDSQIRIVQARKALTWLGALGHHRDAVNALCFSRRPPFLLFSGSDDKTIAVSSLYNENR